MMDNMTILRGEKGFTLIELLVVIAIIAILAAILFPVYARLREKARQTQCVSNVKQVTMAFKTYTDDYDQKYPAIMTVTGGSVPIGPIWAWPMDPYVKSGGILACPSAGCSGSHGDLVTNGSTRPYSYFFNARLSGASEGTPAYPSNCIIIGDWMPYGNSLTAANRQAGGFAQDWTLDLWRTVSNTDKRYLNQDIHSPGAVYGFVDGHAKNLRRGDVLSLTQFPTPTDAQKSAQASFMP